jgi:CRP-like cAMP-binding protein
VSAASRTGNMLLDALSSREREQILEDAKEEAIGVGRIFYEPGDVLHSVYLPVTGMVSLLTVDVDEIEVEFATIGREGLFVAPAVLGSDRLGQDRYMGQIEGRTLVVDKQMFAFHVRQPGRLQDLVFGYLQALFSQAGYGSACNARHQVEQRAARWLLDTHDRIDSDDFELRQEFLAAMLAVHRPAVSLAAGALQRAGFITYRRGRITILDREGLESAACECYEKIRTEYSRLVPLWNQG